MTSFRSTCLVYHYSSLAALLLTTRTLVSEVAACIVLGSDYFSGFVTVVISVGCIRESGEGY